MVVPAPVPAAPRLHRLIITRPAQEAAPWVTALQDAGWPAQSLPLMELCEPQDPSTRQELERWRQQWPTMNALMFVSAAAAQHFFAGVERPVLDRSSSPRFWAPGPGTARALQRLGIDAGLIDAPAADAAQFDSESLWAVVQGQLGGGQSLLIVRGLSRESSADTPLQAGQQTPLAQRLPGSGRDWLIQQCEAAGVQVQACVAYERRAPVLDASDQACLRSGAASGSAWLFSSSEALDHLQACADHADWSQAAALATHPRIAQRAREAGFGAVLETRPALADVLRTLESAWSHP